MALADDAVLMGSHALRGASAGPAKDLWEALREKGIAELREVEEVRLERNGELSVIRS